MTAVFHATHQNLFISQFQQLPIYSNLSAALILKILHNFTFPCVKTLLLSSWNLAFSDAMFIRW